MKSNFKLNSLTYLINLAVLQLEQKLDSKFLQQINFSYFMNQNADQ